MGISKKDFKISQHDPRTLIWWFNRREKIDMDPPYQRRGRLWSDSDKAYLIDSIINGYDVPKLYMADFTWGESKLNHKNLPYAIIDGKQRMEAIFDFFDGKIVLNKDFIYLENPSLKLGGLGYQDLKNNYPEIREDFDNSNLMIMSVQTQSEEPIHELFVRLNRSKSLTGAEIRNAMAGPTPGIIRQIAKHEFFLINIKFMIKRGADLNLAAKILLFEYYNDVRETKKKQLDSFVKETRVITNNNLLQLKARQVIEQLDYMASVFLPKDQLLVAAGIVPVYYWFVRGKKENEYRYIREFLVHFENERLKNKRLVEANNQSKDIDTGLIEYDQCSRSPNDLQSHKGRVNILNERYLLYQKTKKTK